MSAHALKQFSQVRILKNPKELLRQRQIYFDSLMTKILSSAKLTLNGEKTRFAVNAAALDTLSPFKVLSRGYSFVTDKNGKVVTDSNSLNENDRLKIKFANGSAECIVSSKGDVSADEKKYDI